MMVSWSLKYFAACASQPAFIGPYRAMLAISVSRVSFRMSSPSYWASAPPSSWPGLLLSAYTEIVEMKM